MLYNCQIINFPNLSLIWFISCSEDTSTNVCHTALDETATTNVGTNLPDSTTSTTAVYRDESTAGTRLCPLRSVEAITARGHMAVDFDATCCNEASSLKELKFFPEVHVSLVDAFDDVDTKSSVWLQSARHGLR